MNGEPVDKDLLGSALSKSASQSGQDVAYAIISGIIDELEIALIHMAAGQPSRGKVYMAPNDAKFGVVVTVECKTIDELAADTLADKESGSDIEVKSFGDSNDKVDNVLRNLSKDTPNDGVDSTLD